MTKYTKMTAEQIKKRWSSLQKRHRLELAQEVRRFCVGNTIQFVAETLGYHTKWVKDQLQYAGFAEGAGPTQDHEAPAKWESDNVDKGSTNTVRPAVRNILKQFAPKAEVKYEGRDKRAVNEIKGKDAEDFEPYVQGYIDEGQTPAVAEALAKAEWAAESAVEKGLIVEGENKRGERVKKILATSSASEMYLARLKKHMAAVKMAARFLDEANMKMLRNDKTLELVAEAHQRWCDQAERVLELHQHSSN